MIGFIIGLFVGSLITTKVLSACALAQHTDEIKRIDNKEKDEN